MEAMKIAFLKNKNIIWWDYMSFKSQFLEKNCDSANLDVGDLRSEGL